MKKPNTNTVKKQLPAGMTPFKKGDPRINRKGRPRKADDLRKYLLDKLDAPALDKDGKQIMIHGKPQTNLDMMTEKMIRDPRNYKEIFDRTYGKVRDEVHHDIDAVEICIRKISPDMIGDPSLPLEEVTDSVAQ